MTVPSVLLIRTPAAQQNRSMDRYADELSGALGQRRDLELRTTSIGPSHWRGPQFVRDLDRRLARFVRYRRQLRRLSADVYHIADHTFADLAAVLPGARTVVTCHDLIPLRAKHDGVTITNSRVTDRLFRWRVGHLRQVAHVACISEQTREDVIELAGVDPARTSVIANGISPSFGPLPAEQRETLRLQMAPPGSPIVLSVSTGDRYKNVEGVLRALAALRAGGTPALLVRAGATLRPSQRALAARLGIAGAIHDLGRVSDERLAELYNLAHVLLFPSRYEGFGWPPLEAMASGTPVVTSEAPALLEITGDAALHAPAMDAAALAAAVRAIIEDPSTAERLARAGTVRAAQYQWSRTAEAFAALYEQISTAATETAAPERRRG